MTETPTPAQDLAAGDDPFGALPYPQLFAAIDTVEAMAHRTPFNAGDSVREDFHACLNRLRRKVVKVQQAMEWASVRGACGTSPHASFLAGWEAALRTAPASARIVWPSPETAETPDRGSADDTAPESVARAVNAVQRWMTADLWSSLGLDDDFNSYMDRNGFGETWAVLLGRVRDAAQGVAPCTAEKCVLRGGHRGPHYSAGDVGTSEPLPGTVSPYA